VIPTISLESFQLGPLTIQAWGLFVALGILAAVVWTVKRGRQRGLAPGLILDAAFWVVIAGLLGARLFFLIESPEALRDGFWASFRIQDGGMAATGGIIGGAIGAILFMRRHRLSLASLADAAAPPILLGEAIGRIGCFLIHDHPGRPTTSLWAVNIDGVPRHDLGLELSVAALAGSILLALYERRQTQNPQGTIAVGALLWYGATRFILDALRATDLPVVDARYAGLTLAQIAGVCGVILAVVLWGRLRRTTAISPKRP